MAPSEQLPLAEVKAHLSAVVDRVTSTHDRVTITRHGRAEAVVISVEDLASLEETLDLLSDPQALKEIEEGREAAARGEGLNSEEIRRRYLGGER